MMLAGDSPGMTEQAQLAEADYMYSSGTLCEGSQTYIR